MDVKHAAARKSFELAFSGVYKYINKNKEENLVKLILYSLADTYDNCYRRNEITSISNLFKTDKKYRETIVHDFMHSIGLRTRKAEFLDTAVIFKR